MTPEEIFELRALHVTSDYGWCIWCGQRPPWPCPVVRLLDALAERDAENARLSERAEYAWQLAQSMVPPEALEAAEEQSRVLDAENARLRAFAMRIGHSEGFADGEYLACSDTPFCMKGSNHSPDCAVYEARAALEGGPERV